MKMSSYELKIYNILKENNISFEQEKCFKDCYNGYYRFDFYLNKSKIILEINGEQHYHFTKVFYKKKSDFLKAQERDRRKISYCLAKSIPIYIIPYWEINQINNLSDLFQKKYLASTKFHNDEIWYEHQQKSK